MGVSTPLRVTRSMALGSSELTVLDQATGYSASPTAAIASTRAAWSTSGRRRGKVVYDARRQPAAEAAGAEGIDRARHDRHDAHGGGARHRAGAPAFPASTSPARPARPTPIATPGSSATPATSRPRCGSATTTTQPTNRLTGGVLPAATWAKYMRVAMAYETPIPLPGLPPPADTGEKLVADIRRAAERCSIPALPAG